MTRTEVIRASELNPAALHNMRKWPHVVDFIWDGGETRIARCENLEDAITIASSKTGHARGSRYQVRSQRINEDGTITTEDIQAF